MIAISTNVVQNLDKAQLQLINKNSLRYGLADAEKDYFLARVSQIIHDSPLGKKIVFKGRTALHHCYLPQLRFSEDLDFGSLDKTVNLDEIKALFDQYDFLEVKKEYTSDATIKIERLKYTGPLGLANSLKIEIDCLQDVILPAKEMKYNNVWGLDITVSVMDIREICAEKIRAMSERARYRDFYDFYLILQNFSIDLQEIINLIKQKEIRTSLAKNAIMKNWQLALEGEHSEVGMIHYQKIVKAEDIKTALESLPFAIITK